MLRHLQTAGLAKLWIALLFGNEPHAHDRHDHKAPVEIAVTQGDDEIPIDIEIAADLALIDQDGISRGRSDLFEGDGIKLVFFGYANCDGICLAALPAMAEAARKVEQTGGMARPILITIDPDRDTPDFMKAQLGQFHPDFIGLTGSTAELAKAREMFGVQSDPVFEDEKGSVFRHGSFIFLIDEKAEVVSILPPVLPPARIAEIVRKYL